jgi:hypothetical protein
MRFRPDQDSKPLVVQDQDLRLFALLYRAGVMTTPMLLTLDPRNPKVLYDRLHRFTGHGYLAKVPNSVRHVSYDASRPDAFVLGYKGMALAREACGGVDRFPIREQDIRHALSGAEFIVSLMLALQATGRALVGWLPDGGVTFTYADQTIYPDAFLTIKDGHDYLRFAVEIDESTESNAVFEEKIHRYAAFLASSECAAQVPWPFRVLTVTRSEARKDNLRRLAHDYGRKLNTFWFVSRQHFSWTNRMSLVEQEQPIFQSARDDTWRAILDVS